MASPLTRSDIEAAASRIAPHVRRTPVLDLGDPVGRGFRLGLKLDSMQPTGSFKVRGAFSLLTAGGIPAAGVVAASGGNFGLAVAHAARELGHRATVFVPSSSPGEKLERFGGLGAEVRIVDGFYDEALRASRSWATESGALLAHAYDQAEVVAGQGTCALEISEQAPEVGEVVVAVGGGGLIAGIASWFRGKVSVIGVESEGCPTMHSARRAGHPVPVKVGGVAASSLGASILGDHAWMANDWVDDSILVSDAEIVAAQGWLWETCRVLAEPAACAPLAALLTGRHVPERGEQVMVVVSGANTRGLTGQAPVGSIKPNSSPPGPST
jgi:threonine dehydratase